MNRVKVDSDEVSDVAAFYRRTSLVVGAVSQDLAAHEFGTWAREHGDQIDDARRADTTPHPDAELMRTLAARYAAMSAAVSDRLGRQSQAAAELADTLTAGTSKLVAGDAAAAAMIPTGGQP